VEEPELRTGMDEELPETISTIDNNMTKQVEKSREEIFTESTFEWIKTERFGNICKFKEFEIGSDGREMIVFQDDTRIYTEFLGDMVLQHTNSNDVLGEALNMPQPITGQPQTMSIEQDMTHEDAALLGYASVADAANGKAPTSPIQQQSSTPVNDNPVIGLLSKSKKKIKILNLKLSVQLPTNELYSVIKDNYEGVDDVILDDVIDQVSNSLLRDAISKELRNIYTKKKRTTNGK
jgi:hypothetical protein